MKNLKIKLMKSVLLTMVTFVAFSLSSCSKDDEHDDLPTYDENGAYWPLKLNNNWQMIANDGTLEDYTIYKTFVYNSKTYYQLKPNGNDAGLAENKTAINEEGGVYKMFYGETNFNNVTTSEGSIDYINTNLAVGEKWVKEMNLEISGAASGELQYKHEGEILGKSSSEKIRGKTYNNVIKTQTQQTVFNTITGYTMEASYEVWLSKGIGLIYEKRIIQGEETVLELDFYKIN